MFINGWCLVCGEMQIYDHSMCKSCALSFGLWVIWIRNKDKQKW